MAEFQINGLKELHQALQKLPANIERNVLASAINQGTNVILKQTRLMAPTQDIRKQLASRVLKAKRGEVIREIYIKSPRDKRNKKNGENPEKAPKDLFYAKFFEFGTASYYSGKGRTVGGPYQIPKKPGRLLINGKYFMGPIKHPGVKPRPFLRPSLDLKSQEAIKAMAAVIRLRLPMETGQAERRRITQRMIQEVLSES